MMNSPLLPAPGTEGWVWASWLLPAVLADRLRKELSQVCGQMHRRVPFMPRDCVILSGGTGCPCSRKEPSS